MANAVASIDLSSPTHAGPHADGKESKSEDLRQPSFEPGKVVDAFRVYKKDAGGWDDVVYNHYRMMRTNQTVDFVKKMHDKWHKFDHAKLTIREAFELLKDYVDSSDPDITLPNLVHMLQTAERAREANKPDWFQLICLIHDMGKIMFAWGEAVDGQVGTRDGPQFALGGDTWVVGCRIPDCTVNPELNSLNPDMRDSRYNTENGIYTEKCGIMNLTFAYGHDEYMYRMVQHNECPFPAEGLAMLRLHSCYPWHRGGAYQQFMAEGDDKLLQAVLDFNTLDLYSKCDTVPVVEELWPYYQALVDKFMPGKLDW